MTVGSVPRRSWPARLWAFARPHTIVGTVVSIVTLWVLAADAAGEVTGLGLLATALVGALATNVHIVGLNQLTDVEIDEVNKPWLPLAAGDLSRGQARAVVTTSAVVAVAAGVLGGPWLLSAYLLGMAVGTAYSARPLRLKRRPAWAAAAISFVRGVVVNVLVYAQLSTAMLGRAQIPARVVVLTAAVVVLGLVIAWLKDVPDAEGDRRHGIATLTLRLGPARVLGLGLAGIAVCELGLVAVAVVGVPGLHGAVLGVGALALLGAALLAARSVDLATPGSFPRFYLRIWRIFYAQYGVLAAAAVLA